MTEAYRPRPESPGIIPQTNLEQSLEALNTILPWQPEERMKVTNDAFVNGVFAGLKGEAINELNERIEYVTSRAFFPGHVAQIYMDILSDTERLRPLLFTHKTEAEYTAMMQQFEGEVLGLEPNQSSNGLRWFASAAGFSSGNYPADAVGALLDVSGEELTRMAAEQSGKFGWVLVKSNNFLIPIHKPEANREGELTIDGVRELSALGAEFFEHTLRTYARGMNAREQ